MNKVFKVDVTWEEPCNGTYYLIAESEKEAKDQAWDLMRNGEYPENQSRCEPFGDSVVCADQYPVVGKAQIVLDYLSEHTELIGLQLYRTRNIVGDDMSTVCEKDGVQLDYCADWHYFEVFGLTDEEYKSLQGILDVRGIR